jgi:sugar phosphate isomerase/epimerase
MTLDLFHAHLEEPDIRKALLKAGPRLIHVHVADTNRQGLGRGHLDVAPCVRALLTIGYAGSVVVEVTPPGPNPFCSIKDDRSAGILDDYIRESLRVLRQHWVESERAIGP